MIMLPVAPTPISATPIQGARLLGMPNPDVLIGRMPGFVHGAIPGPFPPGWKTHLDG